MGTGLKLKHEEEALVFLKLLNARLPTPGTRDTWTPTLLGRTCPFGLFLGSALGLSLGNSVTLATGNVFYYLILQCWQDSHDLHPHTLAGLAWFPGAPPPFLGPQLSP